MSVIIPRRKNSIKGNKGLDRHLYKLRHLVENAFARPKHYDGLPLYRLEHMLKRLGHEISRTSMAHWIILLDDVFKPLINLMREVQNSGD